MTSAAHPQGARRWSLRAKPEAKHLSEVSTQPTRSTLVPPGSGT